MSKRKRLHQRLADKLVSILVLAVFIVPLFLTGKWIGGFLTGSNSGSSTVKDTRTVIPTVKFGTRGIDNSKAPLKPFKEPIVTVTFDDGWESVYTNAFSDMQYEGIHSTQFIVTNTFDNPLYMSKAQLHSMQDAGTQIASHTVTHPDLTKLNQDNLIHELNDSRYVLSGEFGPTRDFASPYAALNSHTVKTIGQYYRSQKTAEGFKTSDNLSSINTAKGFNPLNYKSFTVRQNTSLDDIKKLLLANQKENGWLVITYHQVDDSGTEFSVKPDVFYKQMRLISDSRSRSATVGQVMDILQPNWKASK